MEDKGSRLSSWLSTLPLGERLTLRLVLTFMEEEDFKRLLEEDWDKQKEYLEALWKEREEDLPEYLRKYIGDEEEEDW